MVFIKMTINVVIYLFTWSHFVCAVEEYYYINWSKAVGTDSSRKELPAIYLGHEENEVAECDLLVDVCDINCCEDKDCTEAQKAAFKCPLASKKIHDVCMNVFRESPVLDCVRINSPYIGEFYENDQKFKKIAAFKQAVLEKKKQGHFQFTHDVETMIATDKYVYGQPLRTIFITPNGVSEKYSVLTLPINPVSFIGGYCVNSPVLFLINRDAYCVQRISESECERNTLLQLGTYMMFDEQTNVSLQYVFPQVLSNSSGSTPLKYYAKYMCLKSGNSYVTVLDGDAEKVLVGNIEEDEEITFECSEVGDIITSHFDNKTGMCHNVLVELFYNFLWNGTDILRVEAKYILADIPTRFQSNDETMLRHNPNYGFDKKLLDVNHINESYGYVKQKFSVKFIHSGSVVTSENETFSETLPTVLRRSGNAGYNFDSPVFIITKQGNSSAFEENILQLWKTGVLRRPSMSTCSLLQLSETDRYCPS